MTVHIVTDASCGLPRAMAARHGITVLDLHVDGDTSTAGLGAIELAGAYGQLLERSEQDGVVALHLSSGLSSTHAAALQASAVFDDTVRVIDTAQVGMALGLAAIAAAKAAKLGEPLHACAEAAEDALARSETWLYLHKLDRFRKSGRISASAVVSTLASKPLMLMRDGRLQLAEKTRTQSRALAKLAQIAVERADGAPAQLWIQHARAHDTALRLRTLLEEVLPVGSRCSIVAMPQALALHVGEGGVGLSGLFASEAAAPSVSEEPLQKE